MIIVIGGSGFIGSYLVDKLLDENEEVIITGRNPQVMEHYKEKNVKFIELNIENAEDFSKLPTEGVSGVVLLAAVLPANVKEYDISKYIDVNIKGTINTLEYCRKNGIKKLVSTTTYADVQNLWSKDRAIKEEDKRDFNYTGDHAVYVISKNAAGDIIEHYNQEYNMQGCIFRLPMVYGVGPHGSIYVDGVLKKSGIQTFVDKAICGEDIEIWGDSHLERDIVYVKDVVQAIYKALKSDSAQGLYNITSGQTVTLEEQVKVIIDLFTVDKASRSVYRPEKKNTGTSFLFDISKAKRDFGYEPKYKDYKIMMQDYKEELNKQNYEFLIKSRVKN